MEKQNLKTSPVIIKLRKSEEVSPNDVDLLLSISKVKPKPIPFDLNSPTKNLILKPPTCLSEKLKTALKERKTLIKCSKQKTSIDATDVSSSQVNTERQSLATDLSKLSANKLDSLHGGDKSNESLLIKPPLVMQPSNLPSDRLLDAKHGGGGNEPSVLLESSSSSTIEKSSPKEEPAKKNIKIDNIAASKQSDKCLPVTKKLKRDQERKKSNETLFKKAETKDSSNLLSGEVKKIDVIGKKTLVTDSGKSELMQPFQTEDKKEISSLKLKESHAVDKKELLKCPIKSVDASEKITCQRQSQTTLLSKLSDNKLDNSSVRDESKVTKSKKDQNRRKSIDILTKKAEKKDSSNLFSGGDVKIKTSGNKIAAIDSSKTKSKEPALYNEKKEILSLKSDELHAVNKKILDQHPNKNADLSEKIRHQSQSQTSLLSKPSNNKLDSLTGRDKSYVSKSKKDRVRKKSNESSPRKTEVKDSSKQLSGGVTKSNNRGNKTVLIDSGRSKLNEPLQLKDKKDQIRFKSKESHAIDKKLLIQSSEKKFDIIEKNICPRQSQTSLLSNLSDNKLDNSRGRDKSKVTSINQSSSQKADKFSNIESVEKSKPVQLSSTSIKKKLSSEEKQEPPKKKRKLSVKEETKVDIPSMIHNKNTLKNSPVKVDVKDTCILSETEMSVDTAEKKVDSAEIKKSESNVLLKSLYSPDPNALPDSIFEDELKESKTMSDNESKLQETLVTELTLVSNSFIDSEKSKSLKEPSSESSYEKSKTLKSQSKLIIEMPSAVIKNEPVNMEYKSSDSQEFSEDLIPVKTEIFDGSPSLDEPAMEFDILDEFESNDNDPDEMNSDSSEDSDISADEIDAMLDEGLGDYGKQNGLGSDMQHEEREKTILKVRGKDHFEVLPEGWIEVTHNSGMPIYLHKQSRVCCVSKPYFLGPGSTRKHEIPISAIPCLHYVKQIEKEEEERKLKEEIKEAAKLVDSERNLSPCIDKNNTNDKTEETETKTEILNGTSKKKSKCPVSSMVGVQEKGTNLILPSAKLESVKDIKLSGSLDYLAVRDYCKKRFEFQTITVKRFKTWCGRRKHQKQLKRKQRPFLPDNTQLITCPLPSSADKSTAVGNTSKREFIMNPTGKSPVCILHEYVQHTLRVQPKYIFKELENASTPYGAVVLINDMEYGTGYGSSKKVAKSEAAKSALEVLIPKIKKIAPERHSDSDELQDVEFFDQVRVEDPRVSELSVKAGQPYPYQILLECLKRNYGMGDTEVSIEMRNLKHQKNEFIMKVGKHYATVVCKNKRDGKHRASQSILQQLHPHINSWGSLLRMYGKGSCKTLKEKKEEEQRITELQSKACVNKPNISILNKLKEEMLKYSEKMKSKKPIGKLIPERMKHFSISNSNLKSIEL